MKPSAGTATPIGARPPTVSPGAGELKYSDGAASCFLSFDGALNTTAESGGTVTPTRPSAVDFGAAAPAGHTVWNWVFLL